MWAYLISAKTYNQYESIRNSLLERGKISNTSETVFVSAHMKSRKSLLGGRRGYKLEQLIGSFTNAETFMLTLPIHSAKAIILIRQKLAYATKRLATTANAQHVSELVDLMHIMQNQLRRETEKFNANHDVVFDDIRGDAIATKGLDEEE